MAKDRPDFQAKEDHDLLVMVATAFWDLKEDLTDNGQPGRCSIHEMRIRKLEYFKAWAKGALAALSFLLMALLTLTSFLLARK